MTHYLMYAAPWYGDDEARAREVAEDLGLVDADANDPETAAADVERPSI